MLPRRCKLRLELLELLVGACCRVCQQIQLALRRRNLGLELGQPRCLGVRGLFASLLLGL
jgi:hypothetical protein